MCVCVLVCVGEGVFLSRSCATVSHERVACETRPPLLPLLLLLTQHKKTLLSMLAYRTQQQTKKGRARCIFLPFWRRKAHTEQTRGRGGVDEEIDIPSTGLLSCQCVAAMAKLVDGVTSRRCWGWEEMRHSVTNSLADTRRSPTTSMWAPQS